MMDIAVIGGGHGCYAAAAHLSEEGHSVRFWRRDQETFSKVLSTGKVTLTDRQGTRSIAIDLVTTDIAEAVKGANLVVIPLPGTAHEQLANSLVPYLEENQVVYIPPATFGSYLFGKALFESANNASVSFAETGTLPYLARKQSEDHVRISVYATRLPTGVFPAKASHSALKVISAAYSAVEPLEDALDGALMNAGPIIHPPLILLNAGPLEHFDAWDIHNEGTQPSIRRVTDTLDKERIVLREALGYGEPHFPLSNHYDNEAEEWMYGDFSHGKLTDSGDWREHIDLTSHRYLREDIALGLSFMVSLGNWLGLDLPVAKGLLAVASAITSEDLFASGRSLQNLGLGDITRQQLGLLLKEGIKS